MEPATLWVFMKGDFMRLTKSIAIAVSTLSLGMGAAFAGESPVTNDSDPLGYQQAPYLSYEQGGPEQLGGPSMSMDESSMQSSPAQDYDVYDVYIVPSDTIVLVPSAEDEAQPLVFGNEQG
jgi:hypothetical protein